MGVLDLLYSLRASLARLENATALNSRKLDNLLAWLKYIEKQGENMSVEFDALKTQVAANTAVEASAVQLIHGIADKLAILGAGQPTPAEVLALADALKASASDLGAAVAANTTP